MTFVQCRGLPLPAAWLPPPSITPRIASMPRFPLWLAMFRAMVVDELFTRTPSRPALTTELPTAGVSRTGRPAAGRHRRRRRRKSARHWRVLCAVCFTGERLDADSRLALQPHVQLVALEYPVDELVLTSATCLAGLPVEFVLLSYPRDSHIRSPSQKVVPNPRVARLVA